MSIYVAFHKAYPMLSDDPVYTGIHVGRALSDKTLDMVGDNTGEHISEKNRYYSELTGLYWIWKNTNSELVGLSHYRRFFFYKKPAFGMQFKKIAEYLIGQGRKRYGVYYTGNRLLKNLILTGDESQKLLSEFDAIIPVGRRMRYSVREQYRRRHQIQDFETTKDIIAERHPDFLPAFNEVAQKKELFPCNMFVMKRQYFDSYMAWLFDVLFELEKRSDISDYDSYQKRLYGFMSERLLDVWLTKTGLKTISLPVLYFKTLKA